MWTQGPWEARVRGHDLSLGRGEEREEVPQSQGPELSWSSWTDPTGPAPLSLLPCDLDDKVGYCEHLNRKLVESAWYNAAF